MWRLALERGNREERECLLVLLRTWADQPFAVQGATWVEGNATGAALGPSLAAGKAVVIETPFDLWSHKRGSAPHWSPRYLPERRYVYLRSGDAPAPEGAEEQEPIRIDRDDAGRLRAFLETFERNGPITFEPEVIKAFRKQTGVMGPVAEFLLGARRSITDLSKGAQRAYRKTGGELTPAERARLYGAAVPDDPTDLWLPEGRAEAAERLARAWVERFGAPPAR
ncbi:hypothetical protein [Nocardiopsis alba]|uniref:hypothetical protein n=1 Tax=Nocardiopsis alba TaxID=53437 RepID=UPI003405FD45